MALSPLDRDKQIFFAAMFELSLGLAAVGLGYWLGPPAHALMPRIQESDRFLAGLGDGLMVGLAMAIAILWLDRFKFSWMEAASKKGEAFAKELLQGAGILHVIAISLAAGVGEELLFRGWLQPWLESKFVTLGEFAPWAAISVGALVFGLAHPLSKGYIVLAAVLGFVLGVSFYLTENLLVPIVAHAVYDAVLLIRLIVQQQRAAASP